MQKCVSVSKIESHSTYALSANYWAPLIDDNEETETNEVSTLPNEQVKHVNNLTDTKVMRDLKTVIKNWVSKHMKFKSRPEAPHRNASSMVLDSGATSSFVRPEEGLPITGTSSKTVRLPDGSTIQATHTTMLPFDSIADKARKADVLPSLHPNSLVSIGKLADADYTTIFHPRGDGVTIHAKNTFRIKTYSKPVLQGWRDPNGLWRLSTQRPQQVAIAQNKEETAANAYSLPSIPQTVRYLHAAAGFPTKDSWLKAINNRHYQSWPGNTTENVNKHFPESVETQKGHMKKQRQNVRSTKVKIPAEEVTEETELTQTLAKQNIMIKVFNASNTVYSDQTGRLPVQSSRGNTSIMCLFDVDANYIAVEPIRSHHNNQMIPAYQKLWARVNQGRVLKPSLHILDTEALEAFKAAIKENCKLQLVPPDTHRRNLAERAIQTFKSHFIAILAGVDQSFPMNLWDRLLPQAETTLNLLRHLKKNSTISAYQHVHGSFDYNKTPLGLLGCAVEMHESTNRRKTWDPRSLTGWYVGTLMEHYQCHKIFCKKTRTERISDTVTFQHRYITQPTVTAEDQLIKAIEDLSSALR